MSYNPITGKVQNIHYRAKRETGTTMKNASGFRNGNEELNFAKYCSNFTKPGRQPRNINRHNRQFDPLVQNNRAFDRPQRKMKRKAGDVQKTTMHTKLSYDQNMSHRGPGAYNDNNRKEEPGWKSSIKRVDEYHTKTRLDDYNTKRGKKVVQNHSDAKNPITQANVEVKTPRQRRQFQESAILKKMNRRDVWGAREVAPKLERNKYEEIQREKRENKLKKPLGKRVKNLKKVSEGKSARNLLSYAYGADFKYKNLTQKPGQVQDVELASARRNIHSDRKRRYGKKEGKLSKTHISQLMKF